MQPEEAKQLYERITSIQSFQVDMQLDPGTPDREMLIDAVAEAIGDCINEDGRLIHAPSPWHGFFELWRRHADARARDGAVFFRGHNRVGLACMAAGLYRDDIVVESQRRALLAVDILAHMVERKEIISLKTDDPLTLARSIAQHYGVSTSLLDVTLDPAVAVFFATCGGDESQGAVFVFDWELCQLMDLPVVIPPVSPWSKRLTVQRGFFLDLEGQHKLGIDDVPFEVRFPKLPGFEVRRAGASYVPWPIEEPAVMALMSWIDSITAVHKSISPEILAELDARSSTRTLLNHQFEEMLGFSPHAPPPGPDPRAQQAVWEHLLASFEQINYFVNHLCVQRSGLAADRVLHLQASNRALFEQYSEQVLALRHSGKLVGPQYDELLAILGL
ncbi:MAG TPA: FRG domain-containing protein [Pyrinomonadaceae bacterium]|nr:FRG domain-containing protein [Pyrinomonadaceae bacterium]